VIGWIASRSNLGAAIAMASGVYILAGVLLLIAIFGFIARDVAAMEA